MYSIFFYSSTLDEETTNIIDIISLGIVREFEAHHISCTAHGPFALAVEFIYEFGGFPRALQVCQIGVSQMPALGRCFACLLLCYLIVSELLGDELINWRFA